MRASQLIKHFELNVHNIRLQVVGLISKSNIVDKVRDCLIEWENDAKRIDEYKDYVQNKEMIFSLLGFIILKGTRTILCLIRSENLCIFDK